MSAYHDLLKDISLVLVKHPSRREQALRNEVGHVRDFRRLPHASEQRLRSLAEGLAGCSVGRDWLNERVAVNPSILL
jgi:hypothetical protein